MIAERHKIASLHGAKEGSERDAIIDSFREGREKALIMTNVISCGIDVLQVNMVVNYDLLLMNNHEGAGGPGDQRPDIETYPPHRYVPVHSNSRQFQLTGCAAFQDELDASAARVSRLTLSTTRRHGPKWR